MEKKEKAFNKEVTYYLIIILVAILLSAPLTVNGFFSSHDGIYHFARNLATNTAILEKQIPPLIASNFCKGFGYGWNIFYPPLGTYISGLFSILLSDISAMKETIFLAITMSGIAMFSLMKKITKNNDLSLITAIIYISSTYFLSDIYCRMAMGEVLSFVFFPVLFYGLYDIFYDTGGKNYYITIRCSRYSIITHDMYCASCDYISIICII